MTYRDDHEPLRETVNRLRGELERVRSEQSRLGELGAQADALAREIAHAEALIQQRRAHAHLPLLDRLVVASPCGVSWDSMTGDDRVRFCGQCRKNVYNVRAMTRAEAEQLLGAGPEKPCIRIHRRVDGTVMTADCPVGVRRRKSRRVAGAAALFSGAGIATFAGAGVAMQGAPMVDDEHERPVMGEIAIAPTPHPAPDAGVPDSGARPDTGVRPDAGRTGSPRAPRSRPRR